MNKMNYLFDACVSHRNTQKLNKKLNTFFDKEEDKFYAETNQHINTLNNGYSLYVRCMSRKEYKAIIKGKIITNNTYFAGSGVSYSEGFCFFKYTNDEDALFDYETCLSMFASDEVMLIVALPNAVMKKSGGFYAGGWRDEYCTTHLYVTPGMIHHVLFNISDIIDADTKLQERIDTYFYEKRDRYDD